jgi:hypothetical protein
MMFAHPALLLVLLLLPVAALLIARAERRRQHALERFGDPALLAGLSTIPDRRRRLLRHALRLAGLGLLLAALARPQLGQRPALIAVRAAICIASLRSSVVADAGGTRLAAAANRSIAAPRRPIVSAAAPYQLSRATTTFHRFLQAGSTEIGDPDDRPPARREGFGTEGEPGHRAAGASDGEAAKARGRGPSLPRLDVRVSRSSRWDGTQGGLPCGTGSRSRPLRGSIGRSPARGA